MRCHACRSEVRQDWKFCPSCSSALVISCSRCQYALQPDWRACPSCGQPTSEASPPPPNAREQSWVVRELLGAAFFEPLKALVSGTARAEGIRALVAAWDPANFRRARELAFHRLQQATADALVPAVARTRLNGLGKFGAYLDPSLDDLARASRDVLALDLPETSAQSVLQGAAEANDPRTRAGMGGTAGAILGGIVGHPVIGAMVGAWIGGEQTSAANEKVLEAFDQRTTQATESFERMFELAWDHLMAGALPSSGVFEKAITQWNEAVLPQVRQTEGEADRVQMVERFIDSVGPLPEAVHAAVQIRLPPFAIDETGARRWASTARELFPLRPTTWERSADVEFETGHWDSGMAYVDEGLRLDPADEALKLTRVQLLAALGRDGEAARLADEIGTPAAWLCECRGAHRRSRDAAVKALERLNKSGANPVQLAAALQLDRSVAALAAELGAPLHAGGTASLAALVVEHLGADDANTFVGQPPADRLHNAQQEFLSLAAGEQILYFRDWSMWSNGKTGLALTDRRIVWKCLWEETVSISFEHIESGGVSVDESTITVGEQSVDVEDEEAAVALATVLRRNASE